MKDVVKESILSGRVDMCHRLVPITLHAVLESQFLPESSPTLALVSPPQQVSRAHSLLPLA